MRHFYLIIVLTIISNNLNSQTPDWIWAKRIGNVGSDWAYSVTHDENDNIFVAGSFNSIVDFDPGPDTFNIFTTPYSSSDIYILKLDSGGSFNWVKQMGGSINNGAYSLALNPNGTGEIYATGYFKDTSDFDPGVGTYNLISAGMHEIFVTKLDSTGSLSWAGRMGGPNSDYGYSIVVDDQNNIYTIGTFWATADFDPGTGVSNLSSIGWSDIFFTKQDSAGNLIWAKSIGGNGIDVPQSITLDNMGNLYVTGSFSDLVDFDPGPGIYNMTAASATGQDIFLMKIDSSGNLIWAKAMNGLNGYGRGYSVITDTIGNVYFSGLFAGIVDFDPGPNTLNLTSSGDYDAFVSKLNSFGDLIWAKSVGGTGYEISKSLVVDKNGNVYALGEFEDTVDFDPGAQVFNVTSSGMKDIFILKLDSYGIFDWVKTAGGTTTEFANSISIDSQNKLTIVGNFQSLTMAFDIIQLSNSPGNSNEIFIAKLDNSICGLVLFNISSTPTNSSVNCNGSVSINPTGGTPPYNISWSSGTTTNLCEGWYTATITDANGCIQTDSVYVDIVTGIEELNAAGISIYPNPVNDVLIINSKKEIGAIKIYDVLGKLLYHKFINSNSAEIDVKEFDPGVYFLEIENYRGKFVKQ